MLLPFFLLIVGVCGCSTQLEAPHLSGLTPVSFSPEEPQLFTLSNGMPVLFMNDSEIPTVRGAVYVRGGGLWDPPSLPGISSLMGSLLRHGGTANFSPDALDLELEKLSAGVSSSVGGEYGVISFSCLRWDLEKVFSLFEEVTFEPRFDESRILLTRLQTIEGIQRRKDSADGIAGTSISELLFGKSVYGRVATSLDVSRYTRANLLEAYTRFLRAENAFITLAGDITRDEAKALLERRFGKWKSSGTHSLIPPPLHEKNRTGIFFVPGDFEQATVVAAQHGPARLSSDQFGIQAFNEAFGAGGSSELTLRVRGTLGLVYDIEGGISPGIVKGRNLISFQTKSESAGVALQEAFEVLRQIRSAPLPPNSLELRKLSIINSFVFQNASRDATLGRRALFRLLGYPETYDSTYVKNIQAVTAQDVQGVGGRHWTDDWTIVVVGKPEALRAVQAVLPSFPEQIRRQGIVTCDFREKVECPEVSPPTTLEGSV